ncbi:hypothetical protein BH10ACT3_BH10ACT3_04740 [soil metagenome]
MTPVTDEPTTTGPWIDNHCHLALGEGPEQVVADALAAGVSEMITVGTDAASSTECLALAARLDHVWATAGVHPHDASQGVEALLPVVRAGLAGGRLVAIGECGLDYHYDHSPREDQRRVFAEQIRLAHELELPLVIHTRAAWDETFEILDAESVPEHTVFHCFTGGAVEAQRCLERGAMLSISGIVTFPSAADVREAVGITPLDRLMVETDSPFLTPVPHRGKPNRPALVGLIGARIAELLGRTIDEVAQATTTNARRFYGIGAS